jgi:apolipoprotein D and lipocalin family protein
LAVVALLVGCAAPQSQSQFRAAQAPIYSNASFDLSRLIGDWQQVAGFGALGKSCAPGTASFRADPSGALTGQVRICNAGRMLEWNGLVQSAGPGRFTIGKGEVWWVLWDDTDNRTLAIGTPSGAFGFVLDRTGNIPSDRMQAARSILDFNGYDLTKMTPS